MWEHIQMIAIVAVIVCLIVVIAIVRFGSSRKKNNKLTKADQELWDKINNRENLKKIADKYFEEKDKAPKTGNWCVVSSRGETIESGFYTRTEAKNWITANAGGLNYKTKKL